MEIGGSTMLGSTQQLNDVMSLPVEWWYHGWEGLWVQWYDYGKVRRESGKKVSNTVNMWDNRVRRETATAEWLALPPVVKWKFE